MGEDGSASILIVVAYIQVYDFAKTLRTVHHKECISFYANSFVVVVLCKFKIII